MSHCRTMKEVHYSLYHLSDQRIFSAPFDCLYAVWNGQQFHMDAPYVHNYYLIPYCRRPDDDDEADLMDANPASQISFSSLKQQGVSSTELLTWASSADELERYETSNDSSEEIFYNCSSPWFGSRCQYRFPLDVSLTFSEIVRATFASRFGDALNVTSGACYRFVDGCELGPWPSCLDWRELCDGKTDCPYGEDEHQCEELERNQCSEDEYRCHNGQCIPAKFAREDSYSVDCLDGSDERDVTGPIFNGFTPTVNIDCVSSETFRCEERMARYPNRFACGDGQETTPQYFPTYFTYCANNRDGERNRIMHTSLDHIENSQCRQAFLCALYANRSTVVLPSDMGGSFQVPTFGLQFDDCEPIQEHCHSNWLVFPERSILFRIFQLIYFTNRSLSEFKTNIQPDLICFDPSKCPPLFDRTNHIELNNGLFCSSAIHITAVDQLPHFYRLAIVLGRAAGFCSSFGNETSCPDAATFHCQPSSKCISLHRVDDAYADCAFGEDESRLSCSLNDSSRFQCPNNPEFCLASVAVGNGFQNCYDGADEKIFSAQDFNKIRSYSSLCNNWSVQGIIHHGSPSESNCEWWPCHNAYVHCDGIWDCPTGVDELNCSYTSCSANKHECYNEKLEQSYCLPVDQMLDRYIDECDGFSTRTFYFANQTSVEMSEYRRWNESWCLSADDICRCRSSVPMDDDGVCLQDRRLPRLSWEFEVMSLQTKTELCRLKLSLSTQRKASVLTSIHFGNYPPLSSSLIQGIPTSNTQPKILPYVDPLQSWFCHRGILVLYGRNLTKKCLCPPSYFGAQCQWQSQRVSLTLQFAPPPIAFTSTIFQAVVMLIDESGEISPSHDQLIYLPARDCATRFNLYLLYPNRPVPSTRNYSIRIDFFERRTLNYWASWHLPIPFAFLPVNRITAHLIIPEKQQMKPCPLPCGDHGRCARYNNDKSRFFCRCDSGYSGPSCNRTHACPCSADALCLSTNICVCPLYRFGRHCYLKRSICQSNNDSCENNGLCIPTDDRIDHSSPTCLCKEGYFGPRCEFFNGRINLDFDARAAASSSFVYIHIVTAFEKFTHERTTMLKKMPIDQNRITFAITNAFNLVFVQLVNQSYYLAIVREKFISSENIDGHVTAQQYCPHINEFANATMLALEQVERMKLYPLLCRRHTQLMCFYDAVLMCVCDVRRFANCFLFNHTINDDCHGHNRCENNGRCFQNNQTCPTNSICVCRDCFYGTRCQLSAEGYLFSLDSIIGYYIRPQVPFVRQPAVIKLSMMIVLLIALVGLIDGIASMMTFRRRSIRAVGCGNYLYVSTILSVCMTVVLTIKFFHLLLSQMQLITNRSILSLNCFSIDFLLKSLLASNQWLVACVAFERALSIAKGVRFDQNRYKQLTKRIIPTVLLFVLLSHLHDPIYRQLIKDSDADEDRLWCFVRYPHSVHIYNSAITLLHQIAPLSINFITAIFIIVSVTQSRSAFQSKQTANTHAKEELYRHKHLLYAPCALVLLGSPRLVISFISGCMKTPRDPWLFLLGYFAAFIPPTLTFATFVIPSTHYRREFLEGIQPTLKRLGIV